MGDLAPSLVSADEMADPEMADPEMAHGEMADGEFTSDDALVRVRQPMVEPAPAKAIESGPRLAIAPVEQIRRRSIGVPVIARRRRRGHAVNASPAVDQAFADVGTSAHVAPVVAPRRRRARVAEPDAGWVARPSTVDRVIHWASRRGRAPELRGPVSPDVGTPTAEPWRNALTTPPEASARSSSAHRNDVAALVENSVPRSAHRIDAPIEPSSTRFDVAPPVAAVPRRSRVRLVEASHSPEPPPTMMPEATPTPIRLQVPAPHPISPLAQSAFAPAVDEDPVWPTLPPSALDADGNSTAAHLPPGVSGTRATTTDFSARWAAELER